MPDVKIVVDGEAYLITTDLARINLNVVHTFLARQSHWARDIPFARFVRSLEHSLCFGALLDQPHCAGVQVGFARVVTDRATFAYICDVFTLPPWRGRGVAHALMKAIEACPDLEGIRRRLLVTRDAASLYAQYGYEALATPERFYEKTLTNPYSRMPC